MGWNGSHAVVVRNIIDARSKDMKSIFLWLLGVPIVVIVLLNITGMLGH